MVNLYHLEIDLSFIYFIHQTVKFYLTIFLNLHSSTNKIVDISALNSLRALVNLKNLEIYLLYFFILFFTLLNFIPLYF